MDRNDTRRRLDQITDAGLFEELATAVLREQDPRCRRLVHVGVNAEGKTVKSPSDAIGYFSDDGSLRMVAVHHTTCRRDGLRSKWLTDSDSDFQKTLCLFQDQRSRIAELQATLIVTTNREPREDLVHDIQVAGHEAGIDIEVYTGSAIAHFLDAAPRGQWLRQKYLGVAQTQLSGELLRELCVKSVEERLPDSGSWIPRDFDEQLASHSRDPVSFIVGESGMGKTVACRKCLDSHIEDGGFGLLVTAEVLGESRTLADAVDATLRELHSPLAVGEGREAFALASETSPLLVVVEDVNRAASPARVLEKLTSWGKSAQESNERARWRVLCPVWPLTTALLSDSAHGFLSKSSISLSSFSEEEGIAAVQRRSAEPLPLLDAKAVAAVLGYDPLLIALHADEDSKPEPKAVIQSFVKRSLGRLAASNGQYTVGEYQSALRSLSLELLERKQLEPLFTDVVQWMGEQSVVANKLRELLRLAEVAWLAGPAEEERIVFRHDRVRDHLLADAVAHALSRDDLSLSVMSDPYFAEVIAIALAGGEAGMAAIDRVAPANPLALFFAMRHLQGPRTNAQQRIVDASMVWADSGAAADPRAGSLRQAVLQILAECEGPHVGSLCARIDDRGTNWWALRARFRNGDLSAGIRLCGQFEPGVGVIGHVELIEHVLRKAGAGFLRALDKVLRRRHLGRTERRGALRLAGYASSPFLSEALQESWRAEGERQELLSDYLWACSQCCGERPAELLGPIFDEWAAMPEEDEDGRDFPRVRFGGNTIRWAFRDRVPDRAISYFLDRAMELELRWPLLVMLNGIDDPEAVEFVVRELARQDEEFEGTGRWSSFAITARDEWSQRHKWGGAPMKAASRKRLRELWSNDGKSRHLRRRALEVWSATVARGDIAVLRKVDTSSAIGDVALFQLLRRGDERAIRDLLEKLESDGGRYWWQAGRYVWSDELTECMDHALGRLANEAPGSGSDLWNDLWILPELLMELPLATAERLIKKHWAGLSHSADYVQAALYVGSSSLLTEVRKVVAKHDNPKSLFAHLSTHFGIRVEGRRGIIRLSQIEALVPYFDHLDDHDVVSLWEACNENSWFDWRRRHLDSRAKRAGGRLVDTASAMEELETELARSTPFPWAGQWGEALLKTGVSRDGMMNLVKDWLKRQSEERALLMAAYLVTQFGRRRHLTVLHGHESAQTGRGREIIENASFELRLRSLE